MTDVHILVSQISLIMYSLNVLIVEFSWYLYMSVDILQSPVYQEHLICSKAGMLI